VARARSLVQMTIAGFAASRIPIGFFLSSKPLSSKRCTTVQNFH
jgi:hypothetical protein